ncbi:MAG: radical SAM protein [Bacteroidales bacterium]|nr:radical SAM protein [Bacteroidales bacterium]
MESKVLRNMVYGPVNSRRLGCSLGINLMPELKKVCNFDCIYCECGWNPEPFSEKREMGWVINDKEILRTLEERLKDLKAKGHIPDVITFSGNGEPSLHPDFLNIVQGTIQIRDSIMPGIRVCIFCNAGTLEKPGVFQALKLADERFMKLDSAKEETVKLINQPLAGYTVKKTIEQLRKYEGDFTLQTLFFSGTYKGQVVDNTTQEELDLWFAVVDDIKPQKVMVYTLDRRTPARELKKCSREKLHEIATELERRGVEVILGE